MTDIDADSEQHPVQLLDAASAWLAADPDPDTRAELQGFLASSDFDAVADRFEDRLRFGTAGLRGALGAGPNRMNRVVVRQAAAGLMSTLRSGATVVIAYDARHKSELFALDSAAVVAANGGRAIVLPGPLPTPVLAFAVRHLAADAGVMVTASHNPPSDSGYKVYRGDGAQLISPYDQQVEAAMAAAPLPERDLPGPAPGGLVIHYDHDIVGEYLDTVLPDVRPDARLAELEVVYTPLHGVGRDVVQRALVRLGCAPTVVTSQGHPDPDFPTVAFPDPEEAGAMDEALALATRLDADLVIANDPDADRFAVAIPTRSGGWRMLTGNEVGALLAEHLLSTTSGDNRLVATTVVSSSLLEKIAARHGVRYAETLTGFKWVVRPAIDDRSARFVFGYEEALGYAVNDIVRDKDGITAAVAFLQMVASLRRDSRTIESQLAWLEEKYGRHLTAHRAVRLDGLRAREQLAARMAALRATPPDQVGGRRVVRITDFEHGGSALPAADLFRLDLDDGARVQFRPSGTEPKLKIYGELVATHDAAVDATALDHLLDDARALVDGG